MKLIDLVKRVRSQTRDFNASIFREQDVVDFLNEGIDRCRQSVAALHTMVPLVNVDDAPTLLPSQYHPLLSTYAVARCYAQDEREFKAMAFMNEFENKLEEMRIKIESGEVMVLDALGNDLRWFPNGDYVKDNYYFNHSDNVDDDRGVGGVPA